MVKTHREILEETVEAVCTENGWKLAGFGIDPIPGPPKVQWVRYKDTLDITLKGCEESAWTPGIADEVVRYTLRHLNGEEFDMLDEYSDALWAWIDDRRAERGVPRRGEEPDEGGEREAGE